RSDGVMASRSLVVVAAVLLIAAPLFPAAASVVPYFSLEDLEQHGDVVVLGEVRAVNSMLSEDGRIIVTRATVRVERALKGGPRAPRWRCSSPVPCVPTSRRTWWTLGPPMSVSSRGAPSCCASSRTRRRSSPTAAT